MNNRFHAGDRVSLVKDDIANELKRGATGVIWTEYATEPSAYEVTFRTEAGEEFDLTVGETELAPILATIGSNSEAA